MQTRTRTALEAFIRALPAPFVVFIDDLHGVDPTTVELCDWLLGCTNLSLVIFAFARPGQLTQAPVVWERHHVTRFTLSPLSPLASARLVSAMLPTAGGGVCKNLVHRAAGNPFFLEELTRCAAEGRFEFPLTIQALVQARLDRLSVGARQVLRAAAVLGSTFWTAGVEALLARPVSAELAQLEEADLITRHATSRLDGQDEWTFHKPVVCDAAYASLLDEDRAPLHRAACLWLRGIPGVDRDDPHVLARHAEAGGDVAQASMLYIEATRKALAEAGPPVLIESLAD